MGDLKKLAQKIHTSFNIPVVRCEALQNQDYTAPPAPRCVTRGRFLPDNPSYQDVQWKPLLLTLAYTSALQYWTEGVSLLTSDDFYPLVRSLVELRWCMRRYITLSKQDILKDLGSAIPEAQGLDTEIPQADSIASPTTTGIKDAWLHPMETQWVDDIFPSPRHQSKAKNKDRGTLPVDSTTSPVTSDAKDTQPSPAETPLVDHTTVPSAKLDTKTQKDVVLTTWAASPGELENQVTPITRSGDKLSGPPTPSGHVVKER